MGAKTGSRRTGSIGRWLGLGDADLTSLLRVSGKMLCFYNGNRFGRAGFGYAVAEDSGGSQARAVA
jgi:hypothetical protein